mmetsp:Transcript_4719/g.15218  ORF Transcript_4719/g.15218 Transcript_4719/m.15218 type:complete len:145 (-) Transcript_4719:281-715(-)|eukprot:CAMPEP_0204581790 /NCGR_PEP_ID=MMETSP0661-20131031/44849_1 /ASSEMBLY_ACC=CAM_ASM_000606 /TAXON_ID=109239 /ORGANISM="Alexandrium margalefi, Strain AMGDE01CS-322" /LENGTH=144 /DNA_ID=CAMNT_0051591015 /DNA_START=206 /DNA_END=640 /DNA_ORIENTATION=-
MAASGCEKTGQWQRAMQGCFVRSVITFKAMGACEKVGRWYRAFVFMLSLRRRGAASSLRLQCGPQCHRFGLMLAERLRAPSCLIDVIMYNAAVSVCELGVCWSCLLPHVVTYIMEVSVGGKRQAGGRDLCVPEGCLAAASQCLR